MTIKPLSDRVLIKLEKAEEETTAGGLILMNNSATGEPVTAKVVACGPGKVSASGTVVPMAVKVGDTVVFAGGVPLGIPGRTNMIRVCIVE